MNLDKLGDVPADYEHYEKLITPVPSSDLATDDTYLKWYELRQAHRSVPDDWRKSSLEFLHAEVASGSLAIAGDPGFVIQHLCGEAFYFLIVWTWRNNNEAWNTVYVANEGEPFQPLPLTNHKAVACVWELGVVAHEMQAWARFLKSSRDNAAKQAYLDDRFAGPC